MSLSRHHRRCRAVDADMHLHLPASTERLPAARAAVDGWARRLHLPNEVRNALVLAGYEAMANVVQHAYRPGAPGALDVYATTELQPRVVRVIVSDHGRGLPSPQRPGRGLSLIHALADTVELATSRRGLTISMAWNDPREGPCLPAP